MRITAAAALLTCLAMWAPASGQAPASRLHDAALAWDAGDYVSSLTTCLRLLDDNPDPDTLSAIALQTGELYTTRELTADGDAPVFSPDGRMLAYETGAWLDRHARVLSGDGDRTIAELPGYGVAFSPDASRVAYLKIVPSAALREALTAVAAASAAQRTERGAAFDALLARESRLVVRDLASGAETTLATGEIQKQAVAFGADGALLVSGPIGDAPSQVYILAGGKVPSAVTTGEGEKKIVQVSRDGRTALFSVRPRSRRPGREERPTHFGVAVLPAGRGASVAASAASLSQDGTSVAYVQTQGDAHRLLVAPSATLEQAAVVRSGRERLDAPAFSPDGQRLVFQMMPKEDWELFVSARDGSGQTRITREIQHDVLPRFLTNDRLLGTIGEPRHRRSYLYDLSTGAAARLFHNNTVRTIAPEYEWVASGDGSRVLIVAERDGDTVSPERGVYLVDLTTRVSRDDLRTRLRASLDAEVTRRSLAQTLYAPIAAQVRKVVDEASVGRVYGYQKTLFDFDSKHITQPGNKLASSYLFDTYTSFGYQPEYQWFEARGALGGQSANVLATLKGTSSPDVVYVVSSHYDSVATGPGADDDSSGTAALLETARILARHPQRATVVFASLTGEESGLLGSREFVRRADAAGMKIAGALNNDMIGWANDHRLDSTIRYSNAGIRDAQHAAAMQFTKLITYDALYYKGTDAVTFYEAYGDIVGGLGSYPVLGNPHYHQPHDLLETINHQLVTEVAKTTAATLMLLASSPSRLTDLSAARGPGGSVTLSWTASPEKDVTGYIVSYPGAPALRVARPPATLANVRAGTVVSVKAVNGKGLEGWDWAKVTVR